MMTHCHTKTGIDLKKTIKILTALFVLISVFFYLEPFDANAEYDSVISFPTKSSEGWTSSADTKLIVADGNVGFSSPTTNIGGDYPFIADWTSLGYSPEEFVLLIEINISDVKLLKKNSNEYLNGKFYVYSNGVKYSWSLNDLSLSSGKNKLVLNFRTADKIYFTDEIAFIEENVSSEENVTKETVVTDENISDRFGFDFTKMAESELTVLFGQISISVISSGDGKEEIEPLTDNYTQTEMIVAIVIAISTLAVIAVFSALYAKKEAKRIRRELKRQKRLSEQKENKDS